MKDNIISYYCIIDKMTEISAMVSHCNILSEISFMYGFQVVKLVNDILEYRIVIKQYNQ